MSGFILKDFFDPIHSNLSSRQMIDFPILPYLKSHDANDRNSQTEFEIEALVVGCSSRRLERGPSLVDSSEFQPRSVITNTIRY